MKKAIILLAAALMLAFMAGACADPARTDGTVTAWIGENNEFFMRCTDEITRKLSVAMKDILSITETDVIGLTQANQVVSVRRDGSAYSILSANATEEEISSLADRSVQLEEGVLSVGEVVYSERAAAAVTDGVMLYWVNRGDSGFVLMQKELTGKEQAAAERAAVSLTGMSVPEPLYLCLTGEALTLTATDHTIITFSLSTGKATAFPASGRETAGACLADGRLYRYVATELLPWELETIQNDAIQLSTVTPAPTPTMAPTPTPTPTPTPRITPAPTPTPRGYNGQTDEDGNIYKGARGKTVRKIQKRLQELGYPTGKVDGIYGDQTQLAVNLFYDALHIRERNYITPGMQNKLFARNAPVYDPYMPLQKGDTGLCVLYMQTMLRFAGFDPVKLDGIYGELTVQAVAEYQKAIGYIPADKEVPGEYASRELLEKLYGPEPLPVPTDMATETPVPATQTDL